MNMPPIRLLLVDDSPSDRKLFELLFKQEGYHIQTCSSPITCLQLLEQSNYDLVLIDQNMPGMDGIELLSKIKADHPQIPVLILTGAVAFDKAREAIKLGAVDYIAKPMVLSQVVGAVRKALSRGV